MKCSSIAFLAGLTGTNAFAFLPSGGKTVNTRISTSIRSDKMFFAEESTSTTSEKKEVKGKSGTVYDRLGFDEDKVALGIDVNEVLQWLGPKDDIIAKFKKDNKGMEDDKIEEEVSKFMLDAEMVNAFIAFEKRKADPRNIKAEAEATLSDPSTWGVYAVWIAGGAGFAYVKNVIIEPKYASGEWEEIHIGLPGADRFGQAAVESVAPVVDASPLVDTVSSVVDAASSAM